MGLHSAQGKKRPGKRAGKLRPRSLLAGALVALAGSAVAAPPSRATETMSKEILAVQVRKQGFACSHPRSAEQDKQRSKPNDAMWILVCDNASYRVRLVPKMASEVQEVK